MKARGVVGGSGVLLIVDGFLLVDNRFLDGCEADFNSFGVIGVIGVIEGGEDFVQIGFCSR